MSKIAILTVGVSGSGKTSWAREFLRETSDSYNWVHIERDMIRYNMLRYDPFTYKFRRKSEDLVTEKFYITLEAAILEGNNILISDNNLNPKYRSKLISCLGDNGYKVKIKTLSISFKQAVKRDLKRSRSVGKDVIYSQMKRFNEYVGRKTYIPDPSLPSAVVCDIDGTIAKMQGRSPFDWYKVGEDKPRYEVITMVESLVCSEETHLIFLTGRDGVCKEITRDWLYRHITHPFTLYTRAEGDTRPDTEVKEELFWEHIASGYKVKAIFDDRPCMIRLWYELGIENVISVADPYIEF